MSGVAGRDEAPLGAARRRSCQVRPTRLLVCLHVCPVFSPTVHTAPILGLRRKSFKRPCAPTVPRLAPHDEASSAQAVAALLCACSKGPKLKGRSRTPSEVSRGKTATQSPRGRGSEADGAGCAGNRKKKMADKMYFGQSVRCATTHRHSQLPLSHGSRVWCCWSGTSRTLRTRGVGPSRRSAAAWRGRAPSHRTNRTAESR